MSSANLRATSPNGSFYALNDDGSGDFNMVTQLGTGRGVKLLYSKSKVYVHPTRSERDNIPGYIALLEQKTPLDERPVTSDSHSTAGDLLLAWVPERSLGDLESIYVKVDMDIDSDSPPKQSYIVAPPPTVTSHSGVSDGYAFAIPVSAVFSLQVRPPNPGWYHGSVIINSRMGATFPPLFFHDSESQSTIAQRKKRLRESFDPFASDSYWGGPEVVRWLRRFAHVERSPAEPTIYLVDPTKEDSLAFGTGSGKGSHALSGRPMAGRGGAGGAAGGGLPDFSSGARPSSASSATAEPFMKLVREAGWNIMERFSKVTTYTRRAAEEALENPNLPPQVRRLIRSPQVQTMQDEYESARVYLARWAMGLQEQSDRERGRRLWTARDVIDLEETDVGEFEILDGTASMSLADRRKRVSRQEWDRWFDRATGRLQVTPDEVKNRIFHGGLEDSSRRRRRVGGGGGDDDGSSDGDDGGEDGTRKEAWLFLLGVYDWDGTADERRAQIASLRDHYYRLKSSWWERLENLGGPSAEGKDWREQRHRIEKDVHRTDRNVAIFSGDTVPHPDPASPFAEIGTNVHLEQLKEILLTYNEFNKTLGYVQGMSDLLSPLYAVIQDDAVVFWAFERFMDRMERNFLMDQSGMRAQLLTLSHLVRFMDPVLFRHLEETDSANFFCFFRMILVWYKREFSFTDILRLWDSLFTDYMSANFHLFIALAILEKHRAVIIDHLRQFDEVLKYINELSGTMDLGELLIRAESLFRRFRHMVEVVDKKNNFPAPAGMGPKDKGKKECKKEGKARSRSRIRDSIGRTVSGGSSASAADGGGESPADAVVTPELRELLSRKVAVRQPGTREAKAVEVQTKLGQQVEGNEGGGDQEEEDKADSAEEEGTKSESEAKKLVDTAKELEGGQDKGKQPEGQLPPGEQ